MKFLNYIYYRLNCYYSKDNTSKSSKFEALCTLSLMFYLNLFTVLIWTEYLNDIQVISDLEIESEGPSRVWEGLKGAIPFVVLCYFLFYRKYQIIENTYKFEDQKSKRIGTIKVFSYILGSVFLFFLSLIFT